VTDTPEILLPHFDGFSAEAVEPEINRERPRYEFLSEELAIFVAVQADFPDGDPAVEVYRSLESNTPETPNFDELISAVSGYLEREEMELLYLIANGRTQSECSKILGCPKGSIGYRVARAIGICRAAWEVEQVGDRDAESLLKPDEIVLWRMYGAGVPIQLIATDWRRRREGIGIQSADRPGAEYQYTYAYIQSIRDRLTTRGHGVLVDRIVRLRSAIAISGRGTHRRSP